MFLFQPGSTGNLVKEERDPFSRLHEARRSKFFMQIELRHLGEAIPVIFVSLILRPHTSYRFRRFLRSEGFIGKQVLTSIFESSMTTYRFVLTDGVPPLSCRQPRLCSEPKSASYCLKKFNEGGLLIVADDHPAAQVRPEVPGPGFETGGVELFRQGPKISISRLSRRYVDVN